MPTTTVNGLRCFFVDEGHGTPVVLLHGFPDTSFLWRHQIPALVGAGFRAIAPDLRGRGQSDKPERVEDYRLSAILTDVAGLMDALGIERAHVVGHDWGAPLAWILAALLPQRVDRLVAISVGHPAAMAHPTLEQLQKSWYYLLFAIPGLAEAALQKDAWHLLREFLQGSGDIERYFQDLSEPNALTAALNWYRANVPPERFLAPPSRLPAVQAPTLGIFSTGDNYLTEEAMVRSAEHVTGPWRYERLAGVSHWIPTEAADWLNGQLLGFLEPTY
ncbi:MAG TPA: alpha/beta hydrolase [Ktedonobacterales bacterium]|nr:alpha/beta hydrolase [Ktedonobacterales bacterium]